MLRIANEELELLLRLYKKVSSDILNKTGIEVEGGHVEIYDIYLKYEERCIKLSRIIAEVIHNHAYNYVSQLKGRYKSRETPS